MFHYIPAYGSLSCMTHFLVCYADYWYLAIDGSASLKSASCCMAHLEHMAALECPHQLCCQLYSFWHLLLTSHHCTRLVWKHWLPDSLRKKKKPLSWVVKADAYCEKVEWGAGITSATLVWLLSAFRAIMVSTMYLMETHQTAIIY